MLSTGQLSVLRNLTTIATSAGQVPVSGAYVEIKGLINAGAGTVELRVNGAVVMNLGSLNTLGGVSAAWDGVRIFTTGPNAAIDTTMDDLVVWDTSGSNNNDFLGDVAVLLSQPQAGNGANTGLTPSTGSDHGALVDEATQNADTDYNSGSTAGVKDTYAMTDVSVTGSVKAVVVDLIARKDVTGLKQVCPVYRIGGADYDGSTLNCGTQYAGLRQVFESSPATSAAWTVSEVNGAELGMKVVA